MTAIEGLGTAEELWLAWPALEALPRFTPDDRPLVVVAPHPDDEVLGVGGLMALSGQVRLIAVTDGEASHPGSSARTPAEMAATRRRETADALAVLGVSPRSSAWACPTAASTRTSWPSA
ncbi:PIG-L deacetylase family protein [Actinokineospora sp. G85]|uniref:PIG-L deacetylase family protein n=1 Tax=Actinokineospora sp. G85 TaxID=3406626 RepID=UPI003C787A45